MRRRPLGMLTTGILLAACGREPAPPPRAEPAPPAMRSPAAPETAWARIGARLIRDGDTVALPVGVRLAVDAIEGTQWRVRCVGCVPPLAGLVAAAQLRTTAPPLPAAARDSLDAFLLALRRAAATRDSAALAAVLHPEIVVSFGAAAGPPSAWRHWRGPGRADLDSLPFLLDAGAVPHPQAPNLVVAPPAFAQQRDYLGLRAGIARTPAGWRLRFLVRGD